MTGSVVVSGALARRAEYGGHVWALMQWVLGLRQLGFQVVFLDRLDPDPGPGRALQVQRFLEAMEFFGLEDSFSLDLGPDEPPVGLARREVLERTASSDFLLNIMGYLQDELVLEKARKRVFLDIDPGFGQMWHELGLCDLFSDHDAFVTVGNNLGEPDCRIPTCGRQWIPTLPPVVLSLWPFHRTRGRAFTSVGSWRGPFDPIEFDGETFGLRVHEFRQFSTLPRACGLPFEIALDIDPVEEEDLRRLRDGGWTLEDPSRVASDPRTYRRYVQQSLGEFMVAKGMYVRSRSGWFSDRTACYLASGRPALMQDTGLNGRMETGLGLVTFNALDDAVEVAGEVAGEWPRHSRAARELAVRHLDSNQVLGPIAEAVTA
ncbi:MAG: hypothetical protein HKO65_16520 [Gemmatimonadetes bacterium]|nr:hypothetical protein [Gemmatimonadota bacterium]NNM06701.1 hypothetical protein [Gemmatimonadota bacterium]